MPDAQDAPPAPPKGVLGVVFVTLFLDLLGFGILIPIQPFYAEHFGASATVVTLIGASYSVMQFIFAPLWGRLSDRVGRRPVVLTSIAIAACGFLVFGFSDALWMLFAARMVAGFGNANIGTVQAIVADVTTGKDRAKGMGIVGAAFGLGFIFGPIIGGVAGAAWGPASAAFISAGLAGLNWILAFFLLKETRRPASTNAAPRGFMNLAALGRAKDYVNVPALLVIMFVFTFGFSMMESSLALFVEHTFVPHDLIGTDEGQKLSTKLTTYILGVVGVTAVIVQGGLIGRLRKKAVEKSLIVIGCASIAVSFALLPFAADLGYSYMFPVVVVLSFGSGIFSPSQSALLSRSVGGDEQGGILGVGQSMSALGRIFGPASSGLLFEHVATGAPLWAGAVLVAIGGVIALSLRQIKE
ncbi:MAG TPA: MFS transporter [Myxococcota bacterium]